MKKIIYLLALFTLFIFLIWASTNEVWRYHLFFDLDIYYARYQEFIKSGSFAGFGANEYLPVSLFFFLIPGVFNRHLSSVGYFNVLFSINLLLVLGHLFLYRLIYKKGSAILPLILFAAVGPILLFRFELLVSFLFLLSIYFYTRKNYLLSGMAIGVSIATKIYPAFTLPYFLILLLKRKEIRSAGKHVLGTIIGILFPVVIYLVLGGNITDPIKNLTYHFGKPAGLESIISSLISAVSLLKTGLLPHIVLKNGIWGIPIQASFITSILPYLSLVFFYIYLFAKSQKTKEFSVVPVILAIVIFLITSKYLNPQYLFWVFSLIPIMKHEGKITNYLFVAGAILTAALTQLTYPIFFSQILGAFGSGIPGPAYFLLQARNILIIAGAIFLFVTIGGGVGYKPK